MTRAIVVRQNVPFRTGSLCHRWEFTGDPLYTIETTLCRHHNGMSCPESTAGRLVQLVIEQEIFQPDEIANVEGARIW